MGWTKSKSKSKGESKSGAFALPPNPDPLNPLPSPSNSNSSPLLPQIPVRMREISLRWSVSRWRERIGWRRRAWRSPWWCLGRRSTWSVGGSSCGATTSRGSGRRGSGRGERCAGCAASCGRDSGRRGACRGSSGRSSAAPWPCWAAAAEGATTASSSGFRTAAPLPSDPAGNYRRPTTDLRLGLQICAFYGFLLNFRVSWTEILALFLCDSIDIFNMFMD